MKKESRFKSIISNIKKQGLRRWMKSHDLTWLFYFSRIGMGIHKTIYSFMGQTNHSGTSLSDNDIYPLFCLAASKNRTIFKKFRKNKYYIQVVETLPKDSGTFFVNYILQNGLDKVSLSKCLENDLVGGPHKYYYDFNGTTVKISPTTLRYIKIYQDLSKLFDFSSIHSISEIGIGYGGQCSIILKHNNLDCYSLIDLPEVVKLTKKYLTENQVTEHVEFIDGTTIDKHIESDLFISNYAFSELKKEIQDIYFKYVISHAKAGYIIYNPLGHEALGAYSAEEILSKIDGSYIIDEHPLSYRGNCIIVWGSKYVK